MRIMLRLGIVIACYLTIIGPVGHATATASTAPEPTTRQVTAWKGSMQKLNQLLTNVLIDAGSDVRFNAPKHRERIENNVKAMQRLAESVRGSLDHATPQSLPSDADPSIPMMMNLFADQVEHAAVALQSDYRPYAQRLLLSMSGYCIGCHTRSQHGARHQSRTQTMELNNLTPLEKANFFAASRQYTRALKAYRTIVRNAKLAKQSPNAWEEALRKGLAIAVRVEHSPAQALRLINSAMATDARSTSMKNDTRHWQQAVHRWMHEERATPTTSQEHFTRAKAIFTQASKQQQFPKDHRADIDYLRAMSHLHEALRNAPHGSFRGDAQLMLGQSYEILEDRLLWSIHELYYEACIRDNPHTRVARRCLNRLTASINANFTGSSGRHIPKAIRMHLNELHTLAR